MECFQPFEILGAFPQWQEIFRKNPKLRYFGVTYLTIWNPDLWWHLSSSGIHFSPMNVNTFRAACTCT